MTRRDIWMAKLHRLNMVLSVEILYYGKDMQEGERMSQN